MTVETLKPHHEPATAAGLGHERPGARILIATGGAPHSGKAVALGGEVAQTAGGRVTILMVARGPDEAARAQTVLAEARARLADSVGHVETKLRLGDPAEEIIAEAAEGDYDLLVMGERPAHRLIARVRGTVRERVLGHIRSAVLIAKGEARHIHHILLCDSGAHSPSALSHFIRNFADWLHEDVEVTVLHVMSQISAAPGLPHTGQLHADAELLIREQTPEGEWLERDIEVLGGEYVRPRAQIRHGLVVDEILNEAREGNYDLVVIGAHRGEGWQRFLLTDVAREIILKADRPVLVVH
ncbi:MAG: universal stress protein [Candidatus Promineifilaceae bacterium]